MVKPIPAQHLRRYVQAEDAIKDALQRALTMHTTGTVQRSPFGLATLQALHQRLFGADGAELAAFVLYVAPLIRNLAMQMAERQAMIQPVKLKLIDLEQWLRRLDELDPECVRIIELRYFAGLSLREVAAVLGVPVPDILGRLRFAKAWLQARVRWSPRSIP